MDVDLDHVATLPPPTTTLPPTTGTPVPNLPVGPGPGPIVPLPPVGLPPITGKTIPGLGLGPGQLPNLGPGGNGLSKVNPIAGLPPRDSGIMGGRQVPTSGPNPGIPRGTVIGTEGTQTGRGMTGGPHGGGGAHAAWA